MNKKLADVFTTDGALSRAIEGFQPRPAQRRMAEAIAAMDGEHSALVVEAETGTGKTFAYLAPALLASQQADDRFRVVVSTGTKALQEQLYHRDLPRLRDALSPRAVTALLKGRANYLCIQRMEQFVGRPVAMDKHQNQQTVQQQAREVRQWANQTKTGDLSELTSLPEDALILPQITSTTDNCLGRDCPAYDDCYLVKARQRALDADIVIVNHHLFFADTVLKDGGFGELIPAADMVIFDEAHQIPDIASQYFSESLSTRQLRELGQDMRLIYSTELKDLKSLNTIAEQLEKVALDLRLQFSRDAQRGSWRDAIRRPDITSNCQRLTDIFERASAIVKEALGRSKTLDQCYERLVLFRARWEQLTQTNRTGYSFWYETTARHLIINQTPLSVADRFSAYMKSRQSRWVFTSATLAVDGQFNHFTQRLGLKSATTLLLSSPFDFSRQAMLYTPRYMPAPSDPAMAEFFVNITLPLVEANYGGTFLLFTSYRMLNQVAEKLQQAAELDGRPVLIQGSTTKRLLLERFVEAGNAVLLGTSSFWEGVDVRGDALRLVVIDKLPFAAPDDPLLQARLEDCTLRGGKPFRDVQIPEAVITLKQGAGRLIRDTADSGVLVVCDQRLSGRDYGGIFLTSLPAMQRTRRQEDVIAFLQAAPVQPPGILEQTKKEPV